MIKLNKKNAENTAIFSTAKNVSKSSETFRLSDKIKVLYRYLMLPKVFKGAVFTSVNSLYDSYKLTYDLK